MSEIDRDIKGSPLTKPIQVGVDSYLKTKFFCVPGEVVDFDESEQTATLQICIQKQTPDGFKDHPQIIVCPVQFSGCDVVFGHEIKPGCEGLIHFSQRAVSNWMNTGGVVEPDTLRKFDINDAFFSPGYRSIPNAFPNFVNDGAWMATKDGQIFHLKNDGTAEITVKDLIINSPETVINGHLTVNGDFDVTGYIKGAIIQAAQSLMVMGKEMLSHVHSGVSRGNQNTDGPV